MTERAAQNTLREQMRRRSIKSVKITDRMIKGIPDVLFARADGSMFLVEAKSLKRVPLLPLSWEGAGISRDQRAFILTWPGKTWFFIRAPGQWVLVDPRSGMGAIRSSAGGIADLLAGGWLGDDAVQYLEPPSVLYVAAGRSPRLSSLKRVRPDPL